jgi:hypothetical protein
MKIETAIKRAKEKAGDNKKLLKIMLFNIGCKYYRGATHPAFIPEWEKVKNE